MDTMNEALKIMNLLDTVDYGFKDENGKNVIENSLKWEEEFQDFYYLLSPEELLKKKCGVCWDQVELERKLFCDLDIKCNTYFIYIDDNKGLPSHTFLTFTYNDKIYWFEHSWYDYKGIHEYNDSEELLTDITKKFLKSRENEIDGNYNLFIYQYEKPDYHINCNEFYEYLYTQKLIKKEIIRI